MDVQILDKFHKCLVLFFDELIDMFPNEKEFIILRILVKDQIPSTQIMSYFVYVHNNEEIITSIQKRDDQFFLKNILFSKFSKSEIFKNLWENNLDQENKDMIWKWVDAFMKMTKNYIDCKN
jgi:gluconate kinase